MLRLIKFLFTGDWHLCQYELVERIDVYDKQDSVFSSDTPIGYEYVKECKHCGVIKTFKV